MLLKLQLVPGSRLYLALSQSDLRAACSTVEVQYFTRLVAELPTALGWGRGAGVMVRGEPID